MSLKSHLHYSDGNHDAHFNRCCAFLWFDALNSRTATKLVREWIDLHADELEKDWQLAQAGKEILKIEPLD